MKKLKSCIAYRTDLASFATGTEEKGYKYYSRKLDEQGRSARVVYFNPSGKARLEETFIYNEKGNLLEESTNHLEEDLNEKTTYNYDEKGNCIEEAEYYSGEIFEKSVHEYDAQNHKIKSIRLDEDNNEIESDIFEYNADGKLIRHAHYGEDKIADWNIEAKYNDEGKVVEEIKRDLIERKAETTAYGYNEKGEKIRTETKDDKGKVMNLVFDEYDENGNIIHNVSQVSAPSSSHITRTIEYDEQNRQIDSEVFDELHNCLLSKELTEFDEDGSIIEQEIFELRSGHGMTKTHILLKFENEYR